MIARRVPYSLPVMYVARTVAMLLAILLFGALREPRLLSPSSLTSILLWVPILVVMSVGQLFVIVSKGIDVSVGSALGLVSICIGMLFRSHPDLSLSLAMALSVVLGAALGALNGVLIAGVRIPPIIATLGTLSVFRGATFLISRGEQVDSNYIPMELTRWSLDGPFRIGSVPIPWVIVIPIFIAVLGGIYAHRTKPGLFLFAVGSNPESALSKGVPVKRVIFVAYMLCGAMAGLGGFLYISRYGFVNPTSAGQGMELTVIAATVIGGCDVRGGSGSVLGAVLGSALLGTIAVSLAVLGIAADWQMLVYGAVILFALILDGLWSNRNRLRGSEA